MGSMRACLCHTGMRKIRALFQSRYTSVYDKALHTRRRFYTVIWLDRPPGEYFLPIPYYRHSYSVFFTESEDVHEEQAGTK